MSDPETPRVKRDRREAAREKARIEREAAQRKAKRRRLFLQGGISVAVLAVVLVVALIIINAAKPAGPGPKNMADDGIIIGKGLIAERTGALPSNATPKQRTVKAGVISIRTYEDFSCPVCLEFEQTNAAYIKTLVQSGQATLQIYPVAILATPTRDYSTRAANAAACVANYSPDQFYEFHRLLYANQPKETGPGLPTSKLVDYAKQAKVTSVAKVTACINGNTYKNWVGVVTDRFTQPDLPDSDVKGRSVSSSTNSIGTPTVIVNGKQMPIADVSDAAAFKTFVETSSKA